MAALSRWRRMAVISLLVIAALSFLGAVVAHWGPEGNPPEDCEAPAATSRSGPATTALATAGLAGAPGRVVLDDEDCGDSSGLAYWAVLVGLGCGATAVVLANLHRAPDSPPPTTP
jgi:peptidoglycan/LPS O-acetylase OafA/YrhL